MKKRFEYLLLSVIVFIIGLNFISAAPTFLSIPANATGSNSLWYGNQSLSVLFNATNSTTFVNYSINDTAHFTITQIGFDNITSNQSAILVNKTPMAVGSYAINVTVNQSGGLNWTIFLVQVNKANYYDCGIYFNTTTTQIYPTNFSVFTNCSSTYQIYRNGSPINNNTFVNAGAGYYNITVTRTDTANYTNIFDNEFFTVNQNAEKCQVFFSKTSPLENPDNFSVWANCTSAFVLARNGTTISNSSAQTALAVGGYNFSIRRNDTSNYSYIYNENFPFTIITGVKPTYTQNSVNESEFGQPALFSINATDNFALEPNGMYIFSTNNTGGWINDSGINFTAISQILDVTKNLNSTVGNLVEYRWYFNDSAGNTNSTPIYNLTTTADTVSPTYTGASIESTLAERPNAFSINVNDNIALQPNGQYIFSTDNSGSWVNDSAVNFTSISQVISTVKTLTTTVGAVVQYKWYFKDSAGNTNSTPIYEFTTTHSVTRTTGTSGGSLPSPTTYTADEQFSGTGDSYNLKASDKVTFTVDSASHSLTLNQFNSTTAKVNIQSTPITAYLQKGVLYKFDTNGDSVNDLAVRYDGLVSGEAVIFMQDITPSAVSNNNENTNTNTNTGNNNTTPTGTTTTSSSQTVKIVIIVVAVVIVIFIIISLASKKKKNKNTKQLK
jgi:hypothetical protein